MGKRAVRAVHGRGGGADALHRLAAAGLSAAGVLFLVYDGVLLRRAVAVPAVSAVLPALDALLPGLRRSARAVADVRNRGRGGGTARFSLSRAAPFRRADEAAAGRLRGGAAGRARLHQRAGIPRPGLFVLCAGPGARNAGGLLAHPGAARTPPELQCALAFSEHALLRRHIHRLSGAGGLSDAHGDVPAHLLRAVFLLPQLLRDHAAYGAAGGLPAGGRRQGALGRARVFVRLAPVHRLAQRAGVRHRAAGPVLRLSLSEASGETEALSAGRAVHRRPGGAAARGDRAGAVRLPDEGRRAHFRAGQPRDLLPAGHARLPLQPRLRQGARLYGQQRHLHRRLRQHCLVPQPVRADPRQPRSGRCGRLRVAVLLPRAAVMDAARR